MKIYKASSEWNSHYLVCAESVEQAIEVLNDAGHTHIDYDSVFSVEFVSTSLTEPCVLEQF